MVTTIYTFATGLVPVFCAVPCTIYVPLLEAIAPLCSRIVILGCELVHPDKITIATSRTKQIMKALFIFMIITRHSFFMRIKIGFATLHGIYCHHGIQKNNSWQFSANKIRYEDILKKIIGTQRRRIVINEKFCLKLPQRIMVNLGPMLEG